MTYSINREDALSIQMLSTTDSSRCVVLIHGTWGGRSAWTLPGSAWITALSSSVDIARFTWCGSNRQAARINAAVELAKCLSDELRHYDVVHLIAHSHGGNIATITASIAPARVSSIVTLATPYVHAENYHPSVLEGAVVMGLWILGCFAFFIGTINMPAKGRHWLSTFTGVENHELVGHIAVFVSMVFAVLTYLLLKPVIKQLQDRVNRRYIGSGYNEVAVLALYYVSDEAFHLLHHVSNIRRYIDKIPQKFDRVVDSFMDAGFVWSSIAFLIVLISIPLGQSFSSVATFWSIALISVPVVFLIKAANWFTPIWSGVATLGADCWMDMIFARIRIRRTPAGPAVVKQKSLHFGREFIGIDNMLVHSSICQDRRVILAAIKWINNRNAKYPSA